MLSRRCCTMLATTLKKNITQKQTMRAAHGYPGIPGENIPINLNWGKYKMTLMFMIYFGVPLGAPWLIIWHQMTRQ